MKLYRTKEQVEKMVEDGRPLKGIVAAYELYQEGLQHKAWMDSHKESYLVLWPESRDMSYTEYFNSSGFEKLVEPDYDLLEVKPKIVIDYSENPDYVTFEDWLLEREQVLVTGEPDAEGAVIPDYYVDGDLLREFVPSAIAPYPGLTEVRRKNLKEVREESLNGLIHTFADGSTIQVRPQDLPNFNLAIAQGVTRKWVMADNSIRMVTVAEMQEAVAEGITQGSAIWDEFMAGLELLWE